MTKVLVGAWTVVALVVGWALWLLSITYSVSSAQERPTPSPWFCTTTSYSVPVCTTWDAIAMAGPTPGKYFLVLVSGSEIDPDDNDWRRFSDWAIESHHQLPVVP